MKVIKKMYRHNYKFIENYDEVEMNKKWRILTNNMHNMTTALPNSWGRAHEIYASRPLLEILG